MINLSILVGVQCWVYLVVAVGPVTCSKSSSDDNLEKFNFDALKQQLNNQWNMIMKPSWWSKSFTDDRKGDEKTAPATAVVSSTKLPRRLSKLSDGFFNRGRPRGRNIAMTERRHVTTKRPKKADKNEKHNVISSMSVTTTNTEVSPNRTVFGTENECMLANNGRQCLCYMIDFLDLIGQRLDETASENQTTMETMFQCPSYKQVPVAFDVFPTLITSGTKSDENYPAANVLVVQKSLTNADGHATATVPVRKEVNFGYVVNYQLETSKDGILI